MLRENVVDLLSFVIIARERSFTKAAAQLGVSQSGLSHAIRGLEERLGLRLLTRTTRQVSLTSHGEHLLSIVATRFEDMESELVALTHLRERPAGNIRLTASDSAVFSVLRPKLAQMLKAYPDINVEVVVDYGFTDIVAEQFDAGVRLGDVVSPGMIAMPIGPNERLIAVGSPDYFAGREGPQLPQDLLQHNCINLRLPHGGLYAWEFEKDGKELRVRVEGQTTVNTVVHALNAALDGLGVAYLSEKEAAPHIAAGSLVHVLDDWSPSYSGYHLYYSSRRQHSAAFIVLLETLRFRA